jgi:serine protease AprX
VLDENGQGNTSDLLRALDWVLQNKDAYGIRVVNMSLGHPVFDPAGKDPW